MNRGTSLCLRLGFLLAVTLLAGSTLLFGQSTTTGGVWGVIQDESGGAIPGVAVKVASDALVSGERSTLTDDEGIYRFPSLPPGTYRIEASLEGFVTAAADNVRINLGGMVKADLVLKVRTDLIKEEILVTADAAPISTVSSATPETLTIAELDRTPLPRNANAFMNLAPGVNNNHAYGASLDSANAYNMDGVNVSATGQGGHWILPNPDWIQEYQVGGLGADAQYGGFTGAMVNIVTKSGGNEFHGDVRFYYSGGSLIADNDTDQGYKEISFSVGGPIIKDKAWFFFSGQEIRDEFTPYEAPLAEEERLSRYLGKLTFQFNDNHKLMGSVIFDGKWEEHRGVSVTRMPEASQKQESPNFSYNLTYEAIFNDKFFMTTKITGYTGEDDRLAYNGKLVQGRETVDRVWVDNNEFTRATDEQRATLDLGFTALATGGFTENDAHQIRFGLILGWGLHNELRTRNGGYTIRERYDSSDWGDEIYLFTRQKDYSFYLQDSWTIGRLTINPGIRFTVYKAGFENSRTNVYDTSILAPRLGAAYDVFGDGSTVIKAHVGRYDQGLFTWMYDRERSGKGFTATEYYDYNPDTGQYDIPAGGAPATQATLDPGIDHPYVDQYVFGAERVLPYNFTIGVDVVHRKFHDLIAMVNLNDDYDAQRATDNPLSSGNLYFYDLLSEQDYHLVNPGAAYRDYSSIALRLNKRFSDNWSLRYSLVWSQLTGNTDATDGYAPEWQDLNGQTNYGGKLPNYSPWESKLNVTYYFPYDIFATVYYTYLAGEYWTPYAQMDGLYYNDRADVFLTGRGSQQYPDRHYVDLKISKGFKFADRYGLDFTVDIFNLLDKRTTTSVDEQWGWYVYDYTDHPNGSFWDPNSDYGQVLSSMRSREIRLGVKFSF